VVTLAEMRSTVRRMTGRYSTSSMQDAQVDNYINLAYTIQFPEQFKNLKLLKPYVFLTTPNVDTYQFVYQNGLVSVATSPTPTAIPGNIAIGPPAYCQGYVLRYFQDKSTFYNRWPKLTVNQQIGVGDGTVGAYSGTIPNTPFLRAQLDIFGNVTEAAVIISAYDDLGFSYSLTDVPSGGLPTGNLVDSLQNVVGTVNYFTGAYTFTSVTGAIPTTATIYASVVPYQASRPTDIFFYNQQLVLRPVPQQVYQIELQIQQQPTDLIADGDQPELDEWYLFICSLASELIYTDFPDPEGMAYLKPILDQQRLIAQRRTLKQLSNQRAQTIFSQPTRPLGGYFYGSNYSGN